MSAPARVNLRHLDHCLADLESVTRVRAVLDKITKCREAVEKGMNLADILHDPANQKSLAQVFGKNHFESGMQLLLRLVLQSHLGKSFTVHSEIESPKKREFIFRMVGGWRQFDLVMSLQFPGGESQLVLMNPLRQDHWRGVEAIPAGTLVTVHLKTLRGKRAHSQELLALERFEAVFETAQDQADLHELPKTPVIQLERPARNGNPSHPLRRKSDRAQLAATRNVFRPSRVVTSGPPILTFRVTVNKMDTFVHAGNAQLIIGHIKEYSGKIDMFVLRDTKKQVRLDADSIWGAEIRNGETVVFDFFGPQPNEEFVKELARKVNKYTQMDKIAGDP